MLWSEGKTRAATQLVAFLLLGAFMAVFATSARAVFPGEDDDTGTPEIVFGGNGVIAYAKNGDIRWINPVDRAQDVLHSEPGAVLSDPAWSPDGTMVAYIERRDDNYSLKVLTIAGDDIDASGPIEEGPEELERPVWSPDGRRIAYGVRNQARNRWELFTRGVDGSDPQPATQNVIPGAPAEVKDANWPNQQALIHSVIRKDFPAPGVDQLARTAVAVQNPLTAVTVLEGRGEPAANPEDLVLHANGFGQAGQPFIGTIGVTALGDVDAEEITLVGLNLDPRGNAFNVTQGDPDWAPSAVDRRFVFTRQLPFGAPRELVIASSDPARSGLNVLDQDVGSRATWQAFPDRDDDGNVDVVDDSVTRDRPGAGPTPGPLDTPVTGRSPGTRPIPPPRTINNIRNNFIRPDVPTPSISRLSSRPRTVTRRGSRLRVSGSFSFPSRIPADEGCVGVVPFDARYAGRRFARGEARLRRSGKQCGFRFTVNTSRARLAKASKQAAKAQTRAIQIRSRFQGNNRLKPTEFRRLSVPVRIAAANRAQRPTPRFTG